MGAAMRDIMVLARDLTKYEECCASLIPQVEISYRVKFERIRNMFYCDEFRIMPLLNLKDLDGKKTSEIHKFDDWAGNPYAREILEYHARKEDNKILRDNKK